ncbi:MAG TPA: phosphotransferase [Actinomycetes bacterium]|nr:phosphotransferase [Actinomycetes bacterium]
MSELVAVARTTDESWRSPLGDAAARAWGRTGAVFVRSSACHVFVTDRDADGRRLVLRMRPADGPGAEALRTSARVAAALCAAGAPMAAPVPALTGDLVQTVDGYAVMALETVEGDTCDSDDVDPDRARRWGATLADLHDRAVAVDADVVADPVDPVDPVDLPRSPGVFGLLHGDPEADNLVWAADGTATFVDPDDVHRGWYAADVAFALRDWAPPAGAPDLADPVPRAFVEGYRARRRLTDEELGWMPLHARAAAARTLRGLGPVLAEPVDPAWPAWAHDLRARVADRAAALRRAIDG